MTSEGAVDEATDSHNWRYRHLMPVRSGVYIVRSEFPDANRIGALSVLLATPSEKDLRDCLRVATLGPAQPTTADLGELIDMLNRRRESIRRTADEHFG